MNVTSDDLCQITHDVCEAMLGLQLTPTGDEFRFTPTLVASVRISGTWNAAVEVAVCKAAGNSIAEAMFDTDKSTPEETVDAVSEVANMIGGNIKGLMGDECELSLPCVGESLMDTDELINLAFQLNDGFIHVLIKHINSASLATTN